MHQIIHSFTYPLSIHSSTPSFIHHHLPIHSYFPPFHPSFAPPFLYFLPNFIHYIRSLIRSYILTFIHSFIDSSIHHTFIHSFIHPIVRSFINAPVHSIPCIDSSIHSFTHLFILSFVHSSMRPSIRFHAPIHSIYSIIVPVRGGGLAPRLPSGMLRSPSLVIAPACCLPHAAGHLIRIYEVLTAGRCRAPGPAAPPRAVSAWGIRHQRCTSSN